MTFKETEFEMWKARVRLSDIVDIVFPLVSLTGRHFCSSWTYKGRTLPQDVKYSAVNRFRC